MTLNVVWTEAATLMVEPRDSGAPASASGSVGFKAAADRADDLARGNLPRFSLMAPANARSTLALIAGAFSVACAVSRTLELDYPFAGIVRVPSDDDKHVGPSHQRHELNAGHINFSSLL